MVCGDWGIRQSFEAEQDFVPEKRLASSISGIITLESSMAAESKLPPLSPQQSKVLKHLRDEFYASGSMPTLREICKRMGWKAVGSAQTAVNALVEKGYLKKDSQKARGLQLSDPVDFRPAPILGEAPAGTPLESVEAHEGDVLVPSFLRGPVFAVRVKGDSMMLAGIRDGDLAIVRQGETARANEIVVAMIDGEVTIKRLVKRGEAIWLYPENPKFKPRRIESSSFRILGTVIGLHRYF